MNNLKGKRGNLLIRIKAARDNIEKFLLNLIIKVKKGKTSNEVKIKTLFKDLDKIKGDIENSTEEELVAFDETELKRIESIIEGLEKPSQIVINSNDSHIKSTDPSIPIKKVRKP